MHKLFTDLIPDHFSNQLLDEFSKIHWFFTPSASNVEGNYDPNDKNIQDSTQYVHGIADNNKPCGPMYQTVVPILWFFEKESGYKIKNILRIKANSLTQNGTDPTKYNPPHVDVFRPGFYSLIYYINDSDGDTVLFDQTIDKGHKDLTVQYRCTPKKGSALFIPSHQLHASSCPVNTRQRMVINFVLELE